MPQERLDLIAASIDVFEEREILRLDEVEFYIRQGLMIIDDDIGGVFVSPNDIDVSPVTGSGMASESSNGVVADA